LSLTSAPVLPAAAIARPAIPGWLRARPELLLTPLLLALILGAWEAVVGTGLVSRHLLPPPSAIVVALVDGLASGLYAEHAAVTALQAAIGFAIACASGVLLGGAIAEWALLRRIVYPYMVALQTMPKIALAPLLVVWFGFGMPSKIAVATVISFFPVLVNTIAGLDHSDAGRLDVLRALGA
jgi:NitT/TauT family transport system permease protein